LGDVEFAPFEVKLQPGRSSREPDIFFVAKERLDRLTQDRMNGPPDLIVEVVSQDSVKRDRSDKYREYQAAGVREYWVIDPREEQRRADFFHLDAQGEYRLFATEEDERVESQVLPGFWLRPGWLWQTDSRDPLLTFCEMAGLPEAVVNRFREQMQAGFER
jgi:Uma2 family endonuclease